MVTAARIEQLHLEQGSVKLIGPDLDLEFKLQVRGFSSCYLKQDDVDDVIAVLQFLRKGA